MGSDTLDTCPCTAQRHRRSPPAHPPVVGACDAKGIASSSSTSYRAAQKEDLEFFFLGHQKPVLGTAIAKLDSTELTFTRGFAWSGAQLLPSTSSPVSRGHQSVRGAKQTGLLPLHNPPPPHAQSGEPWAYLGIQLALQTLTLSSRNGVACSALPLVSP